MFDKFIQRPRGWQHYSEDSGSESHPLVSSGASVASHSSYRGACMFADSETSDQDNPRPPPREMGPPPAPQLKPTRRPFTYATARALEPRRSLDEHLSDVTYNRFQYYSKLRAHASPDSKTLAIPDHVIPASLFITYCSGEDRDASGKQNSLVTIFSIWNTIMGSSLLAMPWGFEQAGLSTGLLIAIGMAGLCLYTAHLLLKVDQLHGSGGPDGEVAGLCRELLGPWAEHVAQFFSLVVLLGADIVYWVLMSNFLFHSVDSLHVALSHDTGPLLFMNHTDLPSVLCQHLNSTTVREQPLVSTFHDLWDLDSTVPIFLVVIIGPLVNFRSASFFTKFNSLGALSAIYLVLYVQLKGIGWGTHKDFSNPESDSYVPQFLPTFPALSGMLALSLFIHNIIITLMRGNRHQENNTRDLSIAYILVTLTYILIGAVFYICFPLAKSCIKDNLLDNSQSSDVMTAVARAFLFFQLVTVFPLMTYMLRSQFFAIVMHKSYPSFAHILAFNIVIVLVCMVFAIYLPRIGTIIRFTGALSGLVYIFTLPCLLILTSQRRRGELTWLSVVLHVAIPIAGGANLLAQFFVPDT